MYSIVTEFPVVLVNAISTSVLSKCGIINIECLQIVDINFEINCEVFSKGMILIIIPRV